MDEGTPSLRRHNKRKKQRGAKDPRKETTRAKDPRKERKKLRIMARAELASPVEELRGKLTGKSGITMRIKTYRDDSGHIIKRGPQECFNRRTRDFQRSPRTANEAAQAEKWRNACREASVIVKDKNHPRYAELRARWNAQFKGGGDAFLNEGKTKCVVYGMFPVFVRMVLLVESQKSEVEEQNNGQS